MPRICWFNEYHIDECTTEDFINSSSYFSVLSRLCSLAPQAKMALLSVVDERVLRLGLCSAGNRYNIYKTNSKPSNHYHFNTFENFDKEYKNTNFVKNSSNDWLKEDNLQDSYTIALTRERKKKTNYLKKLQFWIVEPATSNFDFTWNLPQRNKQYQTLNIHLDIHCN